jgi:hypothetical protein
VLYPTDEQRRESELAGKVADRITLRRVDPVRTEVDLVDGPAASADSIARLEYYDLIAALAQRARRRESGQPGAEHEDALDVRQTVVSGAALAFRAVPDFWLAGGKRTPACPELVEGLFSPACWSGKSIGRFSRLMKKVVPLWIRQAHHDGSTSSP